MDGASPEVGKWRQVTVIAAAEALAMGLWFSASAVVPQLRAEWQVTDSLAAWITMAVQAGFVAGALVSALLNLADRFPARLLFAVCAALGAVTNGAIALWATGPAAVLALRFATGLFLAGVYPPGMKLVATWCRRDLGLGIGILVGALTAGSALPHLLNGLPFAGASGLPPWRPTLLAASAAALVAAVMAAAAVRPGPHLTRAAPFDLRFAGRALAHQPTRLANFGYLGHMWELYAMWAWMPIFLLAAYQSAGWSTAAARWAGFATIAAGAPGCVIAGLAADRVGRTAVTIGSLALSGACALAIGFLFDFPAMLTAVAIVWGAAVVADSAQFSAAVSELSDSRYVGTALTVQTCLGFLLTLVSIRLLPALAERVGWHAVFATLAAGPVFGIWAMARLRRLPASQAMASGHR